MAHGRIGTPQALRELAHHVRVYVDAPRHFLVLPVQAHELLNASIPGSAAYFMQFIVT